MIPGEMDPGRGVLGGELHEVVAALDVVIQAGDAHAELVGHRLHRDTIESDLVGRVGDHVAIEPRRTPGLAPDPVPRMFGPLGNVGHTKSPRMPRSP